MGNSTQVSTELGLASRAGNAMTKMMDVMVNICIIFKIEYMCKLPNQTLDRRTEYLSLTLALLQAIMVTKLSLT